MDDLDLINSNSVEQVELMVNSIRALKRMGGETSACLLCDA